MKVSFITLDGYEATAYLGDKEVAPNVYQGENEHTEKNVWVKSSRNDGWVEINPILAERERIIELLNEELTNCYCETPLTHLDARIKETK